MVSRTSKSTEPKLVFLSCNFFGEGETERDTLHKWVQQWKQHQTGSAVIMQVWPRSARLCFQPTIIIVLRKHATRNFPAFPPLCSHIWLCHASFSFHFIFVILPFQDVFLSFLVCVLLSEFVFKSRVEKFSKCMHSKEIKTGSSYVHNRN